MHNECAPGGCYPVTGVWDMKTFEEASTFVVAIAAQMLVYGVIFAM